MCYTFSDRIVGVKPSAIREILKLSSDPSVIGLSAGNPAPEAFPVEAIRKITQNILAENPINALQYSLSEGYTPLREALRSFCKQKYNIGTEQDEVIVVSGATQGMEMSCKILCNEGDVILCENPSFIGSLNAFRTYGTHLVGIPMQEDGINVELLEQQLKTQKNVRYIYVIPNFQNPTGITMSWEKRCAVYRLAQQYDVLIVEDNPYGDLRFEGEHIPAIKTLDTDGRVIYVGSFSKIISPGLRVGYVVLNKQLAAKITVAKQSSDVHTSIFSQMICHEFLTQYDIDAHISMLQSIYRKKYDLMRGEIEQHFSPKVLCTKPQGGLFIWCTLPNEVDVVDFCKQAVLRAKVAVVPGNAFAVDESEISHCMRVNYSTPTNENISKGIQLLGALTKELL